MISMMKCCLNKNVLIGAGAIALAMLVVSPDLAVSALPVLIVAVCPLSMLLMMRTMRGGAQCDTADAEPSVDERAAEIASMHEEINVLKARQHVPKSDPADVRETRAGPPTAPMNTPGRSHELKTQER